MNYWGGERHTLRYHTLPYVNLFQHYELKSSGCNCYENCSLYYAMFSATIPYATIRYTLLRFTTLYATSIVYRANTSTLHTPQATKATTRYSTTLLGPYSATRFYALRSTAQATQAAQATKATTRQYAMIALVDCGLA